MNSSLSFWMANRLCENEYDTHLASIHNNIENNEAYTVCNINSINSCWIGLTDVISQLNYIWLDATNYTYSPSIGNQPNNTNNKHCTAISNVIQQWNEEYCNIQHTFLCNAPNNTQSPTSPSLSPSNYPSIHPTYIPSAAPIPSPTQPPQYQQNIFYSETTKYILIDSSQNWWSARNLCQQYFGTSLAIIHDSDSNNDAYKLCNNIASNNKCWLGLTNIFGEYEWMDDQQNKGINNLQITNYLSPNYDINNGHCAYFDNSTLWNVKDCDDDLSIILCDAPLTASPTTPTLNPTVYTAAPSLNPTNNPSLNPTAITQSPSYNPTVNTAAPSVNPTLKPTSKPSINPTFNPTKSPSYNPTPNTAAPSTNPSLTPTFITMPPSTPPILAPTVNPSINPTFNPTKSPSYDPTSNTAAPSINPTLSPTNQPTYQSKGAYTIWCDDMSDYSATGWTGSYLTTSTSTEFCSASPCLHVTNAPSTVSKANIASSYWSDIKLSYDIRWTDPLDGSEYIYVRYSCNGGAITTITTYSGSNDVVLSPVFSLPSTCDYASTISLQFRISASVEVFYLDNVCLTANIIAPTPSPTQPTSAPTLIPTQPTLIPTHPTLTPTQPTFIPTFNTISPSISPTLPTSTPSNRPTYISKGTYTIWCDDMSDYSSTGWTGTYLTTSTSSHCASAPCLYVIDSPSTVSKLNIPASYWSDIKFSYDIRWTNPLDSNEYINVRYSCNGASYTSVNTNYGSNNVILSPVFTLPSSCNYASTISLRFRISASIETFYLDNVCLTANIMAPTPSPTQTTSAPTLRPSQPTMNPSPLPTTSSGYSKILCGTNRWCYYMNIYPQQNSITTYDVTIQNLDDSAATYFEIYVTPKGRDCIDPTITFIAQEIDFSATDEYLRLYYGAYGTNLISQCDGQEDDNCLNWLQCLNNYALSVNKLSQNIAHQFTIYEPSSIDDLCDAHSYSINAVFTIKCSGSTASPTSAIDVDETIFIGININETSDGDTGSAVISIMLFILCLLYIIPTFMWATKYFFKPNGTWNSFKRRKYGNVESIWKGAGKLQKASLILDVADIIFDFNGVIIMLSPSSVSTAPNPTLWRVCGAFSIIALLFGVFFSFTKFLILRRFMPCIERWKKVIETQEGEMKKLIDSGAHKTVHGEAQHIKKWSIVKEKHNKISKYSAHLIMFDLFTASLEDAIQSTILFRLQWSNLAEDSNGLGLYNGYLWFQVIKALLMMILKLVNAFAIRINFHQEKLDMRLKPDNADTDSDHEAIRVDGGLFGNKGKNEGQTELDGDILARARHLIKTGNFFYGGTGDNLIESDISDQDEARVEMTKKVKRNNDKNGLPDGWMKRYTQNGKLYYQNNVTKETQWKHPNDKEVVPNKWRKLFTDDGIAYYQNDVTKETQWSAPGKKKQSVIDAKEVEEKKQSKSDIDGKEVEEKEEEELPAGWIKVYTPKGRPYYQNTLTKETQWEHPGKKKESAINVKQVEEKKQSEVEEEKEEELPAGWQKVYTSEGRPYYQNALTRETRWDHPGKNALEKDLEIKKVDNDVVNDADDDELPGEWEKKYTKDGKVYYQNNLTKRTQWEYPGKTQENERVLEERKRKEEEEEADRLKAEEEERKRKEEEEVAMEREKERKRKEEEEAGKKAEEEERRRKEEEEMRKRREEEMERLKAEEEERKRKEEEEEAARLKAEEEARRKREEEEMERLKAEEEERKRKEEEEEERRRKEEEEVRKKEEEEITRLNAEQNKEDECDLEESKHSETEIDAETFDLLNEMVIDVIKQQSIDDIKYNEIKEQENELFEELEPYSEMKKLKMDTDFAKKYENLWKTNVIKLVKQKAKFIKNVSANGAVNHYFDQHLCRRGQITEKLLSDNDDDDILVDTLANDNDEVDDVLFDDQIDVKNGSHFVD